MPVVGVRFEDCAEAALQNCEYSKNDGVVDKCDYGAKECFCLMKNQTDVAALDQREWMIGATTHLNPPPLPPSSLPPLGGTRWHAWPRARWRHPGGRGDWWSQQTAILVVARAK